MTGPLLIDRARVTALCQKFGVRRLLLFGSAVRDDLDETTSDVDLLVEFEDRLTDRFDAYFGLKEDLEALFGRPVDLISATALRNPYFAESVARSGRELYPSFGRTQPMPAAASTARLVSTRARCSR